MRYAEKRAAAKAGGASVVPFPRAYVVRRLRWWERALRWFRYHGSTAGAG